MTVPVTIQGVRYHARPLSGEAVRRFLAEAETADPAALLRMAFPLQWSYLWQRDPLYRLRGDEGAQRLVIALLVQPPVKVAPPKVPDAWDHLEAQNRDSVVDAGGPTITLDTVCQITENVLGASWYYAPDRWPTVDGYAPVMEVWRAWEGVRRRRALDAMSIVRGIGITKAGEAAEGMFDKLLTEAIG